MSRSKLNQSVWSTTKSPVFWCVMGFLLLFSFIAPFGKGLFNGYVFIFEENLYGAISFTALIAVIMQVGLYREMVFTSHKQVLSFLVWLLPLSYLLSSFQSASNHLATNEIYIRMAWVAFFLIGAYYTKTVIGHKITLYAIICSGYALVIYGLMNWFGNVSYEDALLEGNRLSNVFQYPNTYAAYLIAILIGAVILLFEEKHKLLQFGHAFMLVPIFISFLLTLSRGGMLILPIVVLALLIFLPLQKQVLTLIYLALVGVASYLIFSYMTEIRKQLEVGFSVMTSVNGWLIVFLVSAVMAMIIIVIQNWTRKSVLTKQAETFRLVNFLIPLVLVVFSLTGSYLVTNNSFIIEQLPEEIRIRVEGLNAETGSVSTRASFYSDSIKIFKDYPVFGAGGGAWSTLYNSYKSYPYISTQTHNFFMQYLVESGIVGLLSLMVLIIYSLVLFVRDYFQSVKKHQWDMTRLIYPLIVITILAHSMLDFDMSYLYLSALVFLSLGAAISKNEMKIKFLEGISHSKGSLCTRGYIGVSACLFVLLFVVNLTSLQAAASYMQAHDKATNAGTYNEIIELLDKAIKLKSKHPEYVLSKANLMQQIYKQTEDEGFLNEAKRLLESLKEREEYNKSLITLRYEQLILEGEREQAATMIVEKIAQFPWEIDLYEKVISLSFSMGLDQHFDGATFDKDYWKYAVEIYDELQMKQDYLLGLSYEERYNSRHFTNTPSIAMDMGRVFFLTGEYDEAHQVLRPFVSTDIDNEYNRLVLRWFLATLRKQNMDNQNYYQMLINKYPDEKNEIEYLVSLEPMR